MKKIRDFITHKFIFWVSPKLYKLFWKKKFSITGKQNRTKLEPEILLLPHLINDKTIFFDIGSNIGLYLFWAEKLKVKEAYAFEPLPDLYKKLKSIFPKYNIENLALSSESGNSEICIPVSSKRLLKTRASLIKKTNQNYVTIKVQLITLDEYCLKNNIFPDFIKVDIEGAESLFLKGCENILKKIKPIFLMEIEIWHNEDYQTVFEKFMNLQYTCLHFSTNKKYLVEYNSIEELQNPITQKSDDYINNFLFIPSHKLKFIQELKNLKFL